LVENKSILVGVNRQSRREGEGDYKKRALGR
jgi:hypothetical protein